MPITQSRMLSLLHAARDYQQALKTYERIIAVEISKAKAKTITPANALSNIGHMCQSLGVLVNPVESAKSIALEKAHFTPATQRRNSRIATRQRQKRGWVPKSRSQDYGLELLKEIEPESQSTAPESFEALDSRIPTPFQDAVLGDLLAEPEATETPRVRTSEEIAAESADEWDDPDSEPIPGGQPPVQPVAQFAPSPLVRLDETTQAEILREIERDRIQEEAKAQYFATKPTTVIPVPRAQDDDSEAEHSIIKVTRPGPDDL